METAKYLPALSGLTDLPPDMDLPTAAEIMTNYVPVRDGQVNRMGKRLVAVLPSNPGRSRLHTALFESEPSRTARERIFLTNSDGMFDANTANGRERNYQVDQTVPMDSVLDQDMSNAVSTAFTDSSGQAHMILVGGNQIVQVTGDTINTIDSINVADLISTRDINGVPTAEVTLLDGGNPVTKPAHLFSYVFQYKGLLVMIERDTLTAWHCRDVGSTYTDIDPTDPDNNTPWLDWDLAPLFSKGGSILFGGSVSRDTGKGPDDFLYFVTTEGEVLMFEIESLATNQIRKIGTFQMPKPLGILAHSTVDGDVWVLTENGLMPLLSIINSSTTYISEMIQETWRYLTRHYPSGWEMIPSPLYRENLLIMYPGSPARFALVYNIQTQAWSRWDIGMDSVAELDNHLYIVDGLNLTRYEGGTDQYINNGQIATQGILIPWASRSSTFGSQYDKNVTMGKLDYEAMWEQDPAVFATDLDYLYSEDGSAELPIAPVSQPRSALSVISEIHELGKFVLGASRLGLPSITPIPPSNPPRPRKRFSVNVPLSAFGHRILGGAVFLIDSEVNPDILISSLDIEYEHGVSL